MRWCELSPRALLCSLVCFRGVLGSLSSISKETGVLRNRLMFEADSVLYLYNTELLKVEIEIDMKDWACAGAGRKVANGAILQTELDGRGVVGGVDGGVVDEVDSAVDGEVVDGVDGETVDGVVGGVDRAIGRGVDSGVVGGVDGGVDSGMDTGIGRGIGRTTNKTYATGKTPNREGYVRDSGLTERRKNGYVDGDLSNIRTAEGVETLRDKNPLAHIVKQDEIGQEEALMEILESKNTTPYLQALPHALIYGKSVVVQEQRIGIDYIRIEKYVLVLIYDEIVSRVANTSRELVSVRRSVRCPLKKTQVKRNSAVLEDIKRIEQSYNTEKIYLLRKYDGYVYLTEAHITVIDEEDENKTKNILMFVEYTGLLFICLFAAGSLYLRISKQERSPIETSKNSTYHMFKRGFLFKIKPVLVLELNRARAEERKKLEGLSLLKSIGMDNCVVYVEMKKDIAEVVFNGDLESLSEIANSGRIEEKKHAVLEVIKTVRSIHEKGCRNIDLSLKNIFMRKSNGKIALLGVDSIGEK